MGRRRIGREAAVFLVLALLVGLAVPLTAEATPTNRVLMGRTAVFPSPLSVNDTAVTAAQARPNTTTIGTPINITATVRNEGDTTQTVQVNASANSRFVGATNVTLLASESRSVWFNWETSKVRPDVYLITIEAVPLPEESDLADNRLEAGQVELLPNRPLTVQVSADRMATNVRMTIQFGCRAIDGLPPYSYEWDFGDGRVSESDLPPHAYSDPGSYRATCTVTDNSAASANASVTVVIALPPFAVVTVDRSFASPGTSLKFKALTTGGTGDLTYTWSFGDGTIESVIASPAGGGVEKQHVYRSAGLYTVTLTVRDEVGGSNQATITVSIAPLTVTVLPTPTSVQPGQLVNFTAFASGGSGGPYFYIWDFGDRTFGNGSRTSHAYTGATTYIPSITISDGVEQSSPLFLAPIVVGSPPVVAAEGPPYFQVGVGLVALAAVSVGTLTAFRRRQRRRRWGPRPR